MFAEVDRDLARARVLELAATDERVVAGAVVGSLAGGGGDRWSDLDLTFAVADAVPVFDVLEAWTGRLTAELDAVHLFDLPSGPSIYRVFLLPSCLQLDISFTPAAEFRARGPRFELLFGVAGSPRPAPPPAAQDLFGHAVHHALRARLCLERGRVWQAEHWIRSLWDSALALACRRRGLPAHHGRGLDALPADTLAAFRGARVASFERAEMLRALAAALDALQRETGEVRELAARVEPTLRELAAEWPPADGAAASGRSDG